MQKFFVAITLALTLTYAFAAYEASNYWKYPDFFVVADSETNYTNMSSLFLASVTPGDLYLVSENASINWGNTSANNWNLWYKKIDTKSLSPYASNSAAFNAPLAVSFYNNYAFSFSGDNDTGIPQIRVYQVPLAGGAPLPRLTLSSNVNSSFTPAIVAATMITDTVHIFYLSAFQRVNFTSFVVGETNKNRFEFILTTNIDFPNSLSIAWGQYFSSQELTATWVEKGSLLTSVVNVKKGTINPAIVGGYDRSFSCSAYVTSQWYGELCTAPNLTNYYIRANSTSLVPLPNYFPNMTALAYSKVYGPNLAIFYKDVKTRAPSTRYLYEIWNLNTLTTFKNTTAFLTIDSNSTVSFHDVPYVGLYTLIYNNKQQANGTLSSVRVGLLLDDPSKKPSDFDIYAFIARLVVGILAAHIICGIIVLILWQCCWKPKATKLSDGQQQSQVTMSLSPSPQVVNQESNLEYYHNI